MTGYRKLPGLFLFASILTGTLLMSGCVEDPTLPVLTTDEAIEITTISATVGGNVTEDGGAEVTARGVCWGTAAMPALEDNFKASGTGSGEFSCIIDGLDPNTEYYARAYAENSVGVAYGNEVIFTTGIAPPSVTTGQVTGVTDNSAICSGTVTYNGGAPNTEKGICWSNSPDPDLDDSHVSVTTGSDTYSGTLTGLSSGTRYYARAYVKNEGGTAYGEQVVFVTKVADIEGNLYSTVYIGEQVWMAENLRTTTFTNNAPIPNVTDNTEWSNLNGPAYCWYNNDISYKPTFGALYSWFTIETGALCPSGWHVPSDAEFNTLEMFLGMNPDSVNVWGWRGTDQGSQLKSTTSWDDGGNGTNTSGFSGLAGGYRIGLSGNFYAVGILTYWWTATDDSVNDKPEVAWYRRLDGEYNDIYKATTYKRGGKYIRCVKN
jgi:uncharacterized protein (TIGR02145 family)